MDVPEGRPVVCGVLETDTEGWECVVKAVWGLLGVPEVGWTTGVPVSLLVGLLVVVVAGVNVD